MKKVRIFLASSAELKEERELFEKEIYRKTKAWFDKGIFLNLEIWEDMPAKISPLGRSQADYNEVIKECDILVLLAYTKVGMYTAEEFEVAYGQFQKTQKPFIFTYFKEGAMNAGNSLTPEQISLLKFKEKLNNLGHFYSSYADFNHLWNQFNKELERLADTEFKEMMAIEERRKPETTVQQNNMGAFQMG